MTRVPTSWWTKSNASIPMDARPEERQRSMAEGIDPCSHAPENLVRWSASPAEGQNLPGMTCISCEERLPAWGYYTG